MRARSLVLGVLGVLLLTGGRSWSGEKDARALLEKAIKAHGGADNLKRWQSVSTKVALKSPLLPDAVLTGEIREEGVVRYSVRVEYKLNCIVGRNVAVVNGDQGWIRDNEEPARAMTAEELAEYQDAIHVNTVCKLLPLRDQAFQLTAVKDVMVNGRAALGLQVRRQGRPDVRLYFDNTTGLLVKSDFTRKVSGKERREETEYREHKASDGSVIARTVIQWRDGEPYLEGTITELRLAERFGPEAFAKP